MSNKDYRKIWENTNGPIPKDDFGRSLEIHHIDGNHHNNDLSNLKLVTIDEHYQIHFNQSDYGACNKILLRMKLSPGELSKRISESNKLRTGNKNPFFGKKHSTETVDIIRKKLTGQTRGPRSKKVKSLISNALKNKPKSNQHRLSIKNAHNTDEYLKKMYKPIKIDNVEYSSIKEAISNSGLSRTQLYQLIKKKSNRIEYIT